MATYIVLGSFTQRGIEDIKDSPTRVTRAREAFAAAGADLREFYLTMGRHDFVVMCDAPDEATIARLALAIGAQGNIRTETLRAFSEGEYADIVAALP